MKHKIGVYVLFLLIIIFNAFIYSYSPSIVLREGLSKDIQIVYYASLRKEKWRYIVLPQMQDLIDCGIIEKADLIVALSGEEEIVKEAETEIRKIFETKTLDLRFTHTYENLHEYPGISALYEEGQAHPEKLYLYFHSKGMWFWGDEPVRDPNEKRLFDIMITNWREYVHFLETNPDKNKICFGCSKEGWCWFNFFWVRGSYLYQCGKPIITDDRYYYERYIGEQNVFSSYENSYNVVNNNKKPFYSTQEISRYFLDHNKPINEDPET
jgi:hypothetical protein